MAIFRISSAIQNTCATAISSGVDAGGSAGSVNFYTAPQPANANAMVTTQVLLATLPFSFPSFQAVSGGTIVANGITPEVAGTSGTTTWARILSSTGAVVFDCDVSTVGATINLGTTALIGGEQVVISSFSISMPPGA